MLLTRLCAGSAATFFKDHGINIYATNDTSIAEALWEYAVVHAFKGNTALYMAIADRLDPPRQIIAQTADAGFDRRPLAEMSQSDRLEELRKLGMMVAAQDAFGESDEPGDDKDSVVDVTAQDVTEETR